MTDSNDPLDRNLARLLRAAGAPAPNPERASRRFLEQLDGSTAWGRRLAMAATVLLAAGLAYWALSPAHPGALPTLPPGQDPGSAPEPQAFQGKAPEPPGGGGRLESPPVISGRTITVKKDAVSITLTLPSARSATPTVQLSGTVPLPEGTALTVTLQKAAEELKSGRLAPTLDPDGMFLAVVQGGRFAGRFAWMGEGRYVVTVAVGEGQNAEVARALGATSTRVSTVELPAWDDELPGRLAGPFATLGELSKSAVQVVDRLGQLAAKESTWIKERRNEDPRGSDVVLTREALAALKEVSDLRRAIEAAEIVGYFPAAAREMRLTLERLSGSAAYFDYEKGTGKFAGVRNYHFPGKGIVTHREEPLSFDLVKAYLAEVPGIAGRETALWMVRDLRRTEARPTPALTEALRLLGGQPGIAPVAERLRTSTLPELDDVEERIRSGSP
jgi:hypothetical protein